MACAPAPFSRTTDAQGDASAILGAALRYGHLVSESPRHQEAGFWLRTPASVAQQREAGAQIVSYQAGASQNPHAVHSSIEARRDAEALLRLDYREGVVERFEEELA